MKLILPILLAVLGLFGGVAAGVAFKPQPAESHEDVETGDADAHGDDAHGHDDAHSEDHGMVVTIEAATDSVYHPLSRRLFVPFERDNGRAAFATVEITLELPPEPEALDFIMAHEPKAMDAFFRVLVGFAATGAFEERTRASDTLRELSEALEAAAGAVFGDYVRGVLISNLLTNDA